MIGKLNFILKQKIQIFETGRGNNLKFYKKYITKGIY